MAVPTPHAVATLPSSAAWWRETQAGTVGSLSVLAVLLTLGLLSFSALGGAAARVGLGATVVTAVMGSLVYALCGRAALPVAGPSSATALILAALVVQLLDGQPGTDSAALARVLSGCAAAVALSGVIQLLLAGLGLARLSRLVPRPVLAGFMNGVALLILIGQVPLLLGQMPGTPLDLSQWPTVSPGALLLGLGTVLMIVLVNRWQPRWPAALLALGLGTLACAAAQALWPGLDMGPRFGMAFLPWPQLLGGSSDLPWLPQHAAAVLTTAAVLALVGALESALNLLALDQQLQARHQPRRELAAVGLSNLICGLLGGLPVVMLRARAMAIVQAGGSDRRAALTGALAMLLLFTLGAPLLAPLPLPVLGGVMVMVAVDLIDRQSGRQLLQWWREPRSADLRAGLGVMLLVCGVTLWQGFAAGVGLGVLLSMTILIVRMNRSLLRSRLSAAQQPSRRVYPAAMAARLQPLRAQIQIWELEGALFFGNAERLLELADELGPEVKALVLDLRRVSTIDETGAAALASLGSVLQRRQVLLLPAGVAAATAAARALQDFGLALQPDADRAIEAAERHLLGPQADPLADPLAELPLADCDLLRGLDDSQKALVVACMARLQLAAGQTLFRQGDAADGLYVLTQGWVSVFGDTGATPQRLLSISPGLMLGETAMLDGGGRSASAVADSVAQLHRLDRASLQALAHDHPAVANTLHRNIALHLSTRLRSATSAWSASQG